VRRSPIFACAALLVVLVAAPGSPESLPPSAYGRTVLALYKSGDGQSERENEVFFHLSRPLREMGLKVRYWDVDRGLPDDGALEDVRALISWFRSPSMSDPEGYLRFLDRSLDRGLKLVVFDNFGAYQDRDSGAYVKVSRLNLVLGRLGLLYFGDWTQDPSVLRIAARDSAMVEHGGPQDLDQARFFYRFLQYDRDLRVYLSLRRTDRSYPESPVVVSNRNGGFALSRYIYRVEGGRVVMLLDLTAFLRAALFPPARSECVALLADTADPAAAGILRYTQELLDRVKLPWRAIPRNELGGLVPGDLAGFTAAALILRDDAGLDPAVLERYLEEGGGVVSLLAGNFRALASSLAMQAGGGRSLAQKGYRFRPGFLLGEGLMLEHPDFLWKSGGTSPSAEAEVLATAYQGSEPIAWTAPRGQGRVLSWGWDGFAVGDFQGFILESLLYVRPVGVAATAGLGVMFVDDWRIPMFNVVKAPVPVKDTEFYTRQWWPDIKRIFARRRIPYASFLVFNYNADTSPPFGSGEFFVADDQATVRIAREILDSGQELALHGYNHVSLTLSPTRVNVARWPSQDAMEQSLLAARREWTSLFGGHALPFAYVAPNNIIDEAGIRAVHDVFPSIKVMSFLRSGGGEEARTPFGPHPEIPGIYYIPRNTSGYPYTPYKRQQITAAVSGPGIWSHFIHADDVYDPNRSRDMSWEELREDFEKILDFAGTHYPWLRWVSLRDAYAELARLDAVDAEMRWEPGEDGRDGRLIIRSTAPGLLLRVRPNQYRLRRVEGATVRYQYKRMSEVILEIQRTEAVLQFER
jgi:hypothetical protein